MHHVYAKHRGIVYHLFSGPDFMTASAAVRFFSTAYPGARLAVQEKLSSSWMGAGRPSAYDFAKVYYGAGAGVILDLRPNPEPPETQPDVHPRR